MLALISCFMSVGSRCVHWPALYEAGFVSAAHTEGDIAATVAAAHEVFKLISK